MEALETVELPESMRVLGSYAFDGCSRLKNINLVEGITDIPAYCFNNCTAMNYLTLPDTVSSVGSHAFYNCKGLRSVNMGSGLKTIGLYAFYGCHGLVRLLMSDSVEAVSDYAFAECINLKSITLSNNLRSIGKEAFRNCSKMHDLIVPSSVSVIGANAFKGLEHLIFYCSRTSNAAVYAIRNNIPIIDTEDSSESSLYVDRENSYYRVNGDGVSASGYLTMVAKYDFLDSVTATNVRLTFNIPKAAELLESTLTVDGVLCTDYTYEDGVLTVPASGTGGTVRFLLKPKNYDRVSAYCRILFNNGTGEQEEVLGTIYTEIPILSITAPARTSETSVQVFGVTVPNSTVTLYVDGTQVDAVNANKVGDYSAVISIPSPVSGKEYEICAKIVDSTGTTVTAEASTEYRESVPVLKSFVMDYGGKTYDLYELAGTKPRVTWGSDYEYRFTVGFDNAEGISSVYIVSTRNNIKKYMEAQWDESLQAFVAQGFFDDDRSYVPGVISLGYVSGRNEGSFDTPFDFTSQEAYDSLADAWKNSESVVLENSENMLDAVIDFGAAGAEILGTENAVLRYTVERVPMARFSFTDEDAQAEGYEKVTDQNGKSVYVKQYVEDGKVIISTVDQGYGILNITVGLANAAMGEVDGFKWLDAAGDICSIIDWAKIGYDGISDQLALDQMRRDVQNSNMSDAEKARALEKISEAEAVNMISFILREAFVVIGVAAGTMALGPGLGLALWATTFLWDNLLDDWDNMTMDQLIAISMKWAIDPSGFIYDIVTGERIFGATVTAYWMPYDEEDETYWDKKPDEDEYGVVWDSTEFSQSNPLTTDVNGWYAWDVPEGWWRVQVEMDGYETAWSDWVPVPPPQTEVHIGMTPVASTLGDLNLDGNVNSDDLTLLARHVGGIELVAGEALKNADVNGDGLVNSDDLTKHARFVGGIITSWDQE